MTDYAMQWYLDIAIRDGLSFTTYEARLVWVRQRHYAERAFLKEAA